MYGVAFWNVLFFLEKQCLRRLGWIIFSNIGDSNKKMAEEEAMKYGGPIGDVIHPLPTKLWWLRVRSPANDFTDQARNHKML